MPTISDTSPDALRVQIDCYRRMTPARKWQLLDDANSMARILHRNGVGLRNPGASGQAVQVDWQKLALGRLWRPQFSEVAVAPAGQSAVLELLCDVFRTLRRLGIDHALSGSLACTIHGAPRFEWNADVTAEPFPGQESAFVSSFGSDYYVSPDAVRDAVRRRASFNLIHLPSGFKVDVFVRSDRPFDVSVLQRRIATPAPDAPGESIDVVSAEDLILLKLEWFRQGNEISDRQWGDVLGVLRVQGDRLDDSYLDRWATDLGVADLLARARAEARIDD